jgi:signal transduction histidine kinase
MDKLPSGNLLSAFLVSGQFEGEEKYQRFERLAEIFTWLAIILGNLIIQLPFGQTINKPIIYVLSVGISVFVIVWYHLIPKRFSGKTKRFIYHLIVISFIAFIVHYTNGVAGHTTFLYFLASLAVAMTLPLGYVAVTTVYTVSLIFFGAFLTPGDITTNLSLATLHSWGFLLVIFFARFNAGEASLVKKREEDITLEKERTVGGLKDEFVYIISHELQQPAAAIKGYVDTILSKYATVLNSSASEVLNLTNVNSDRLSKLLDDLLDISRIEEGSLRIKMVDISLRPIISEVLSNLLLDAQNKRISLVQKGTEEIAAKADIDRLKEILTNLVGNAIKYTPEGGKVVVEAQKTEGFAKISVSDNGVGISEEDKKHLFEKFYRVESEKTTSVKGSGLGLFIAKQLVEKMGGKIGVESTIGQGTVFFFSLPRYRW